MVSISTVERSTPLFFRWLAASAIGTGLGISAGILATLSAQNVPWINVDRFFAWALFLSIGIFLGLVQGGVIAASLSRSVAWFPATIIGFLLASGALIVPQPDLPGLWNDALLFAFMGAAIGIAQWWVLRPHLRLSGLWIAASVLGFQSFLWLVAHPAGSNLELVIVGTILGAIGAAATGLLLHRLRR